MRAIEVPKREADGVKDHLNRLRSLDLNWKPGRKGDMVLLPLQDENPFPQYPVVDVELEAQDRHRPPQERIAERLDLPPALKALLPERYERLGHVLIIQLPEELLPYTREVAKAYATVLKARTVLLEKGIIKGVERRPDVELVYGKETETTHLESGILYRLDPSKVMFSSGNFDEKQRMGRLDCRGETVVDMFAGIGYFTLPIAVKARADRVIACEINPVAADYLRTNARLNGVEERITVFDGDNRDLPGERLADRVVMGYVNVTWQFLPKAFSLVKKGGIIHYQDTCSIDRIPQGLLENLKEGCGGRPFEVLGVREVKAYAPSISHMVVDVRVL
ncbi:MAG: class I SAM-dependent methyltransferase family protein [Methanomassiliicoccales archaeon]|nr:class I SAM-dependent methyltransferase family protein [Methanomassiliicoccales archaeon]